MGLRRYSLVMDKNFAILMVVMMMTLGAVVSAGGAQPDAKARSLVDRLGADTWIERDLATLDLADLSNEISLADLEVFFSDPTLTPEQRARLKLICVDRFVDFPKGGLGVSFLNVEPGSIEVKPIPDNPNFPASMMLQPGDAIARVGGVMMTSTLDLRVQILSREPGETLPVTVIRNNELIEMELPLGSFSDLVSGSRLDRFQSMLALELRWERRGIVTGLPESMGSMITIDQWARVAFPSGTQPNARATTRRIVTAVVTGARELVHAGLINIPRRFEPWVSAERLQSRASEIAMMLDGQQQQVLDARRAILVRESDQLAAEINAQHDDLVIQRLRSAISDLEKKIAELDADTTPDHPDP